jgi:hypothetical protein
MNGQQWLPLLIVTAIEPEHETADWFERATRHEPCMVCGRRTRGRYCLMDVDEFSKTPMCGPCWASGSRSGLHLVTEPKTA